jgi:hypothetical protein
MSSESNWLFNEMTDAHAQGDAKNHSLRFIMRGAGRVTLKFGRQVLACALVYLMIPLGVGDVLAQSAPPPPPPDQSGPQESGPPEGGPPQQSYNALTPDELGQLVAPIALYPDSLVAQILAASTFPTQVVEADRFVQAHPGVPPDQLGQMVDGMQWDPSVKALIAFPSVLSNLDKNLDWTTQLGNAYFNQPQDVMSEVQVMRQRAYDSGNLKSNQQLSVEYQPNNIVIAPANPAVVYVPYYNPWGVYGAPIVAYGAYYPPPPPPGIVFGVGLALGFGIGIAIGSWNHWGWGWHNWGVGWGSHSVVYNRNVYISRSTTVINHNYGYGHFDRNPAARAYNRSVAARAPHYDNFNHANNFNHVNNVNHVNNFNHVNNVNHENNFNHDNFNHNNVNAHPGANNNFNHPANNNNFNHPANNVHPANNANFNRPANNVSRPTNNGSFNRPTSAPSHAAAPASHPQQTHAAPQSHSESHGGGGHPPHK